MKTQRNRKLIGSALIVGGIMFLLVSNHILLGWENVWPLFPILGGAIFLRLFASRKVPELLFAGIAGTLLGVFLLLFSTGIFSWEQMAVAWPTIPLVAGLALVASSTVGGRGGTGLLVGASIVVFSAVLFLLESGAVNARVATPLVRFWPLVLIMAGLLMLRLSPRETGSYDEDMVAVRELIDRGDEPHPESATLESRIVEQVRRAEGAPGAVAALVGGLKTGGSNYDWVGFYRLTGDGLAANDGEFAGIPIRERELDLLDGVCGVAAIERRTVYVPDTSRTTGSRDEESAVRSEIAVPVVDSNTVIGVLDVASSEADALDDRDRAFLEGLVARVARYTRLSANIS